MIVNTYSILALFMVGLGLALSAVLAAAALWAAWRTRAGRDQQQASAAERSVHLARLVAVVCLAIQVMGWPLFYGMLASFVSEIPGAMCIYGVTKVMPATTAIIQVAKPAVIFILGAWLLVDQVRRRAGRPLRRAGGVLALAAVAGLVAFSDAAELYYVLNMKSLNTVSCCSSYGESGAARLQAPSYYLPWAAPGPARRVVLTALFFAGVPLLAFWLARKPGPRAGRRPALARAGNVALLVVSIVLALASLMAFSDVAAPRMMQLPFHHCLYCLITNGRVPESPLILANVAVGIFAGGWAAVLGIAYPAGRGGPAASDQRRKVCRLGATALLAAVLMVAIRLAVR